MLEQMIIDADLCIKLGSSEKYHFLLEVLPLIAKKILCTALLLPGDTLT
jgi:hypothetical protein